MADDRIAGIAPNGSLVFAPTPAKQEMTPLERAARALHAELGLDWPYVYDDAAMKEVVRAVLTAIREPSEEWMNEAMKSDQIIAWRDYREFWQAMIDAALAEGRLE